MALRPGGAKSKGASGERELAALLTEWGNEVGIELNLTRNLEQVRSGGADVNGVPGLEIEVKRVESNGINQWWAQVCKASKKTGSRPLLAHRRNRQSWRFRTIIFAYEYNSAQGSAVTAPVVADLELKEAKLWFQTYLQQNEEDINDKPTVCPPPPPPPPRRP